MANCKKCGALLQPNVTFCTKCGEPVSLAALQSSSPVRPQRPAMMKAPSAPLAPQAPRRPQPMNTPQAPRMPQQLSSPTVPIVPTAPSAPQQHQVSGRKGFFTNAVRSVANAVTGGALNRQIAHEQQQALNAQHKEDQDTINLAQQAQRNAEDAQLQAEREAERQRDRRSMEIVDGVEVVRGRAMWNIQPGEIARRISESELENVEKLKGIIVQEGCTAIIFANGELVSTLSSGAYLFYKSPEEEKAALRKAVEQAEKEMAEAEKKERDRKRQAEPTFRQLGVVGEIGRGFSWLHRIIFGEKKNEQRDKVKKRQIDYARLLARITQAPILSVYIVSNRVLTLTFGGKVDESGAYNFSPYTIPMGIQNVEIAVSLQMRVSDIHAIATNYLADRNNLTTIHVQQMLNGAVETLLRQQLRNVEYAQTGLAPGVVDALKAQIQQTINARIFGLECTAVLSITDNNADFERFRSVERELYNTEKELDFMHRTGEFRNRMEVEANSQQLTSAQTAEELRYALQKLNKDQLLHDDELEEFVLLLESQKRIRAAKTDEEEHEALEDLRKSRLLKADEMDALEDALEHKRIPREEITQLMRIQSQQKIGEASLKAEWGVSRYLVGISE